MAENKIPIIDPDSLVNDGGGNINVTINQGTAARPQRVNVPVSPPMPTAPAASAAPPMTAAWPQPSTEPAQPAATAVEATNNGFSLTNVVRRAKFLGGKAARGVSSASDKLLDMPFLKPLKEIKTLAKVLLIIMVLLLLVSFICFFRHAVLWGILGILVDAGVGVGLFFGVQAMPSKAKLLGIAGIAITSLMLVFCFIRMIMGR